jgi:hypothetical protein
MVHIASMRRAVAKFPFLRSMARALKKMKVKKTMTMRVANLTTTNPKLKSRQRSAKEKQALCHGPNLPSQDQRRRQKVISNYSFTLYILIIFLGGGARVEIEYENDMESVPLTKSALADW